MAENDDIRPHTRISPGGVTGQTAIPGLRIDFNLGARVQVPEGEWRVRIIDRETCSAPVDRAASNEVVTSDVFYYVPWHVEVWQGGERKFSHTMNLRGQRVFVKFCSDAMGDALAWIPYVEAFREKHGCEIWCAMSQAVAELVSSSYPEIHFISHEGIPEGAYATYYLGCFFPSDDRRFQPESWKQLGLQRNVASILGLPREERRPRLSLGEVKRSVEEPYVCIAVQASSQPKYWNNPKGWMELVAWLKGQGYRVLCIDRENCYGGHWHKNCIPWGAEDFTGPHPLRERAELLLHADFFIGLASGLSWLAWTVGCPVVLISGFSSPHTEFFTPYRIINYHVCHGCWEDDRFDFDHAKFDWCPRHQEDLGRQFECTRNINHGQVVAAIERLRRDHGLTEKILPQAPEDTP